MWVPGPPVASLNTTGALVFTGGCEAPAGLAAPNAALLQVGVGGDVVDLSAGGVAADIIAVEACAQGFLFPDVFTAFTETPKE
jgi:hypothetical protein